MKQDLKANHWNDANGNPAGGCTFAPGMAISWQNGPLGRGPDRREPNGAFVETVIAAALDRIAYYQNSRFESDYNARAMQHLEAALSALAERTADRESRDVEGTHAK